MNGIVVIGIDPGFTIGIGVVPGELEGVRAWMVDKPNAAWVAITQLHAVHAGGVQVLIEDFIGSGPRTKQATHTVKQVGFFAHAAHFCGIPYNVVPPFTRKARIEWARDVLGVRPSDPQHAADALAHARVEWERLSERSGKG